MMTFEQGSVQEQGLACPQMPAYPAWNATAARFLRPGSPCCMLLAEGSGPMAAAAVGAAALLATVPLMSPLVQIWLLARKSKEEIEDTVRVKEPLQVCCWLECSSSGHYAQSNSTECCTSRQCSTLIYFDARADLKSSACIMMGKIRLHASKAISTESLKKFELLRRVTWIALWSCGERMRFCSGRAHGRHSSASATPTWHAPSGLQPQACILPVTHLPLPCEGASTGSAQHQNML